MDAAPAAAAAAKAPQPVNGDTTTAAAAAAAAQSDLSQVLPALQAIYDPASSNATRRQATEYLETAKRHPHAPAYGHSLATNTSEPAQLRYYGLAMLEYAIKYNWDGLTAEHEAELRNCIIDLAQRTATDDPVFLRNKVAQLWTEIAKRSWGDAEWTNMDAQLVELWRSSLLHQAIVLHVLETLSEEVFNREDPTAGLRGSELGRACVEIFTPVAVLAEQLPSRDKNLGIRCGDEGWLTRLCHNLSWCLSQDYQNQDGVRLCAIKTMNALRASMSWVMPRAIAAVQVIEHLCKALAVPVLELQLTAVDVLQAIYTRHHLTDDDFVELVCPMFTPGSVSLLQEIYRWTLSDMDVHDLNDQKYSLCKKIAELANSLGSFIEQKPQKIPSGSDLPGIFNLFYDVLRNPSLTISIPVLHSWTKLLRARFVRDSPVVTQMIGGLLEICCQRLIRYESFPEDSEDVTILFLNEDIDTIPERHAFLGNYRRFCADVIEVLVRQMPVEAMNHILAQAAKTFQNLYTNQAPFRPAEFSRRSPSVLQVDAQVTVVDSALKGYLKWVANQGEQPQEDEQKRNILEESFEQWCRQILQVRFKDPEISKKVLQLMSTFATKALPGRAGFAFTFLEHMLTIRLEDDESLHKYSEAVKDLERVCSLETQKLAMKFADDFMNVYEGLENKINEMKADPTTDDRQRLTFTAFLFITIHRTSTLDRATQVARLRQFLNPIKDEWQNEDFTRSVSDFSSFCGLLGLGELPQFLASHNFGGVQDWLEQSLDNDGEALRKAIDKRSKKLPIRLAKMLLAASTERLRPNTPAFEISTMLWTEIIPVMLPNLLQLVNHAHAFNDVEANWSHLPPELQQVIRRVMTDRFWQAGISSESREAFFERVNGSKSTFEGFASTIRASIRQLRETTYYMLFSFSRFRNFFYGMPDFPTALSEALYSHANSLTAHHLSVLLTMSSNIIEPCPHQFRSHFLPPMVKSLFRELDKKISTEWNKISVQAAGLEHNENLTDEMKMESILRQLTHASVSLAAILLDTRQEDPAHHNESKAARDEPPLGDFVMNTPDVLEPLVVFSNATLRFRDTRSVVTSVRALRTLIPRIRDKSAIRDYFCNEILKNAITSLHEPYFVDCQKDLAALIAGIIHLDETTPRSIILSLPGMGDSYRVDRRLNKLRACALAGSSRADERMQRSIVLDLLSSVRGVSIHEQGKIERAKPRSKLQEQYMTMDGQQGQQQPEIVRGNSPELAGVANMFGE